MKRIFKRAGPYLAASFLSLGILFWVTDLWKADFKVLFTYYFGGDLFWNAASIKGLAENSSYLINPNLGAPFGLQHYDYPISEALHALLLWLLNFCTGNPIESINILYVLSYPFTALSAVWVFRRFDIGAIPAVACSLLYAFLYYHFFRGMVHPALGCYYLIPLLFWAVLTSGDPASGQSSGTLRNMLKSVWFWGRVAVCAAVASYGFYYCFFGMFFLVCGGLFAWFVHKYRNGLVISLILAGAMALTSFLNIAPSLMFWAREGRNHAAAVRAPISAEVYGLKITQLLLPNSGHRIPFFAELNRLYGESSGITEASGAGLGLIGGLGFILLLVCILFRNRDTFRGRTFQMLAALNLMGLLLATVGGFGAILSFFGFTQIRGYNRISVFLAFLAFLAVALVWGRLEKLAPARYRPVFIALSLLAGVFGLWDEIPASLSPDYLLSKTQSERDAAYVRLLESSIPADSMIFQLPYVPFPENGPIVDMEDYSHFRPYLHSKHLRWSYGTVKGREGAEWMETISSLPIVQMVEAVSTAGYAGIYIDRFGYSDRGAALESQLAGLVRTAPIVSGDKRLSYFSLRSYPRSKPVQLPTLGVMTRWDGEFSVLERNSRDYWRWCGNSGVLRLVNRSSRTQWIRLNATVKTSWPNDDTVDVKGPSFTDHLLTNAQGLDWDDVVAVPPGAYLVTFSSRARKDPASGTSDRRNLVFALYNFKLTPIDAPAGEVAPKVWTQRSIDVRWGAGAYDEETDPAGKWHWCSAACEIDMMNPSANPVHIGIKMSISTGNAKWARFTMSAAKVSHTVSVNSAAQPLVYNLDLAPGKNVLKLSCDAPRVLAPKDPRNLVFRVNGFSMDWVRAGY